MALLRDVSKKIPSGAERSFKRADGRTITIKDGVVTTIDGVKVVNQAGEKADLKKLSGPVPVLLMPDGSLNVAYAVIGREIHTEAGVFDLEDLASRFTMQNPIRYGRVGAMIISGYRVMLAQEKAAKPSQYSSPEAARVYFLLRIGLITSHDASCMLGTESGEVPGTLEGKLRVMGFPEDAVAKANKAITCQHVKPPKPMVPDLSRRRWKITYIGST